MLCVCITSPLKKSQILIVGEKRLNQHTYSNLLCQYAEQAWITSDWQQIKAWWSIHDLTIHLSNQYHTTGRASDRGINEEVKEIKTGLIKCWDRKGRARQTERERQRKWKFWRFVFVRYNNSQSFSTKPLYQNPRCIAAQSWRRSALELLQDVQGLIEVFTSSIKKFTVGRKGSWCELNRNNASRQWPLISLTDRRENTEPWSDQGHRL